MALTCWLVPDRFPEIALLVQPDRRASRGEVHAVVPCMRPLAGCSRGDRLPAKVEQCVIGDKPTPIATHVSVARALDSEQWFSGSTGDTAYLERRL